MYYFFWLIVYFTFFINCAANLMNNYQYYPKKAKYWSGGVQYFAFIVCFETFVCHFREMRKNALSLLLNVLLISRLEDLR